MSAGSILGENGSMTSMTTEWGTATLPEAGFAPDLEERFEVAREAGVLPNLHGVVAARNGRIFLTLTASSQQSSSIQALGDATRMARLFAKAHCQMTPESMRSRSIASSATWDRRKSRYADEWKATTTTA
jgi:hypothetical protein